MKVLHTAVVLMLLSGTAKAQSINLLNEKAPLTEEERAKQKAVEDAYKARMNKIPDQKAPSDPWATVRTPPQQGGTPPARRTN
jgi:hypothetical protein